MVQQANPARGEAMLRVAGEQYLLRPSFTALVAAEEEVGSLFALVERAAAGELRLAEMAALFWHVIDARPERVTRGAGGEAVLGMGLAGATAVLKQIGRASCRDRVCQYVYVRLGGVSL